MTPRSPVTLYPSPVALRRAAEAPRQSTGLLALVTLGIAVYVAARAAVPPPRPERGPAPAARSSVGPRPAAVVPPALRADLERHPCWGCEP